MFAQTVVQSLGLPKKQNMSMEIIPLAEVNGGPFGDVRPEVLGTLISQHLGIFLVPYRASGFGIDYFSSL